MVARCVRLKSMPADLGACPSLRGAFLGASTTNETWYFPVRSRIAVTDDCAAGSGRVHRTFTYPTFASYSLPPERESVDSCPPLIWNAARGKYAAWRWSRF